MRVLRCGAEERRKIPSLNNARPGRGMIEKREEETHHEKHGQHGSTGCEERHHGRVRAAKMFRRPLFVLPRRKPTRHINNGGPLADRSGDVIVAHSEPRDARVRPRASSRRCRILRLVARRCDRKVKGRDVCGYGGDFSHASRPPLAHCSAVRRLLRRGMGDVSIILVVSHCRWLH